MAGAGQHVGPPLQPHFARQRLADLLAHPGNLDIEGVERQQRAALRGRHEQRGCVAGKIMAAHQFGAEAGGIPARRRRRSWHRDQRRRDAPPLADHDVVGADRRTGLHRVQHDPDRAQRLAQSSAAAARRRCRCRRSACRWRWPRRIRAPASFVDLLRLRRPARPRSHPAGTAASRDATSRQRQSRHCHRPRSAPTSEDAERPSGSGHRYFFFGRLVRRVGPVVPTPR